MEPRAYQQRAVAAVLSNWADVAKEGCLVAPCGAGKTEMGMMVIAEALRYNKRCLWFTHTRDLVEQTQRRLAALGIPVGAIMAGEPNTKAQVQVCSLQTLVSRETTRPEADVVFHDECQHMAAREWEAVAEAYRGKLWLGLTATPERSDGLPLGGLYRWLHVAASYSELLAAGHLVPARVFRPSGLLKGLADDPVAAYLQWGENRSGFVYERSVERARSLADAFTAKGIPAACVDFESTDRQELLEKLRDGRLRLLTNVYTLTEGIDVPSASLCILARGIGHVSTFIQMTNRPCRPAPGKTDALVLDLPGVTHDFGMPTEDREYSLTGEGIRRFKGALPVKCCQKCGLSFPSVVVCPRCGFRLPGAKVRVYGVPLAEAGTVRPLTDEEKRAEWNRLQAMAVERGYSDAWALKVYREKTGERGVQFSDERRKAEYEALQVRASELGYKPGWADARYKAVYGSWPPRQWKKAS